MFLVADNLAYGGCNIASGPVFSYFEKVEGQLIVNYKNADNGLKLKYGAKANGFAVAGADGLWHWTEAIINGNKVIINTSGIVNPVSVQYAWQANPETNLYNTDGFPAIPFNVKIDIK